MTRPFFSAPDDAAHEADLAAVADIRRALDGDEEALERMVARLERHEFGPLSCVELLAIALDDDEGDL